MDDLDKDYFPKMCWGCYDNCYHCSRKINGTSVAYLREMAAARLLKLRAVSRLQKDIAEIDNKINRFIENN